MLRAKVDRLQQQIKSLTAKLESKGLQGMPQDVQTTSDADDLAGLEPDQNIFEVAIKTGELKVCFALWGRPFQIKARGARPARTGCDFCATHLYSMIH